MFYKAACEEHTESAQTWITQFYLQITACLPYNEYRNEYSSTR